MVRWLSPKELGSTAVRVLLSVVFGEFSDKREIQAALPVPDVMSYVDENELWVDYVADLGDAFNPTYAVASLLAQPVLQLATPSGGSCQTARGRLLVMGGDQVYPTPTAAEYRDRTIGPYRAAFPYIADESTAPHVFAIPGNHDWYDGLSAFMRVFCRQQWIGGWKTQQHRSYFATRLREDWWLWGIDIQLDRHIDEPQYQYFARVAETMFDKPGQSVILCSAVPSWVKANRPDSPEAFATLDYFERKIIRANGAEVKLSLAGDLHHYAHYASADGSIRRITAGGGGAFLSATHTLPSVLQLPPDASAEVGKTSPPVELVEQVRYPSRAKSRQMRWRVFLHPDWFLCGLIGALYLIYGILALGALREDAVARGADSPAFAEVMSASAREVVVAFRHAPLALLIGYLVVSGMSGLTKSKRRGKKWFGRLHGFLHLCLVLATIYVAPRIVEHLPWSDNDKLFALSFWTFLMAAGAILGWGLLALYLLVADAWVGCNTNDLFAAQRNQDYKNFVRIHFDSHGGVTIYPVKLETVPKKWTLRPDGAPDDPWWEPDDRPLTAELIEDPIVLAAPWS